MLAFSLLLVSVGRFRISAAQEPSSTVSATHLDEGTINSSLDERCLNWNGFLAGFQQVFELRNAGGSPLDVMVEMRAQDGTIKDSAQLNLLPHEQFDVVINDLAGFEPEKYGTICARALNGSASSLYANVATYKLNPDGGRFDFAIGTPHIVRGTGRLYVGYNTYSPAPFVTNAFTSFLEIANDEPTTEGGELRVYDADGNLAGGTQVSLLPHSRFDIAVHTIGLRKVGLIEWIPIVPGKLIRLTLNRYYFDGTSTDTELKMAVSLPGRRHSNGELVSAANTPADFGYAVLELSNVLTETTNVTVSVDGVSGFPYSPPSIGITIPAKGTRHLILSQFERQLAVPGWASVRISADQPNALVADLLEYSFGPYEIDTISSGQPLNASSIPMTSSYNSFLGRCGIRVANGSNSPAAYGVEIRNSSGSLLASDTNLLVPARGTAEYDVCGKVPPRTYGEVTLTPESGAVHAELERAGPFTWNRFYRLPFIEQ